MDNRFFPLICRINNYTKRNSINPFSFIAKIKQRQQFCCQSQASLFSRPQNQGQQVSDMTDLKLREDFHFQFPNHNQYLMIITCQKFHKFYHHQLLEYSITYKVVKMTFQKAKKYAKISLKRREKLVSLSNKPNSSISKAARLLGLKASTAKLIVKRFREKGTFYESRRSKTSRLEGPKAPQLGPDLPQSADNLIPDGIRASNQINNTTYPSSTCFVMPETPILDWSPQYQLFYWIFWGGSSTSSE